MNSNSHSPTMLHLEKLFPGKLFIPAISAGIVLCLAPQTSRNKIRLGTFPIPTHKVCGKRLAKKSDLADYIDGMPFVEKKKKRGPPMKKSGGEL